jgi:hypothetical protein
MVRVVAKAEWRRPRARRGITRSVPGRRVFGAGIANGTRHGCRPARPHAVQALVGGVLAATAPVTHKRWISCACRGVLGGIGGPRVRCPGIADGAGSAARPARPRAVDAIVGRVLAAATSVADERRRPRARCRVGGSVHRSIAARGARRATSSDEERKEESREQEIAHRGLHTTAMSGPSGRMARETRESRTPLAPPPPDRRLPSRAPAGSRCRGPRLEGTRWHNQLSRRMRAVYRQNG